MRSSSWSFVGKIDCRFGFGLLSFGVSGTLFGVSSQLSLGVRAVMSGGNPEVFFLVCTWVESSIKSSSSLVWSSVLSPEKLLLPIDSSISNFVDPVGNSNGVYTGLQPHSQINQLRTAAK